MEVTQNGSQPSARGPAECFTGAVGVDPPVQAPDPARVTGRASRSSPAPGPTGTLPAATDRPGAEREDRFG
jgi:hypothetical protein